MRQLGCILLALFAGLSFSSNVVAQPYPNKPVTIVVPTGPGGGFDLTARRLEKALAKNLGQSVVIVNRPGSGSLIGTMSVLSAPADGYTLLLGGLTNIVFNASLYKKKPYNPLTDFVGIGLVSQTPYVLIARNDLAERDAAGIKKFALANPGKLNMGNAGVGTGQQVLAAAYIKQSGIDMLQIPYLSAQAVYTDLLGGRVDLFVDTLPSARRFIESKQVTPIFISGPKRDPIVASVPTARELGMPGAEMMSWFGLFAPSKTPPVVIARLHKALEASLADEELRSQLEQGGFQPVAYVPAADTAKFVQSEYKKWTQVIQEAGITLD